MMTKYWLRILVASFFEVAWVVGLKHADSVLEWMGTIISIIISFTVLIKASNHLPVGTVYAVFVGLGTVGTVILDIILFDQSASVMKLGLIGVLLMGVIGLKLVSGEAGRMSWLFVIIAGLFEMLGVVFINTFNQHKTFKNGLLMFGGFGLSFLFLITCDERIADGNSLRCLDRNRGSRWNSTEYDFLSGSERLEADSMYRSDS